MKVLAPPFITKLPLADEEAHSLLSHGIAYSNVAQPPMMLCPSKWPKCGLTGLGAAA